MRRQALLEEIMGYTTDFDGRFNLDRKLTPEHAEYLRKFSRTRRMRRDEVITPNRDDPVREAVGLPVGPEGAYFVGALGWAGQEDESIRNIRLELEKGGMRFVETYNSAYALLGIIDYNLPPEGQPGLWCQWVPTEDLMGIEWDEGEKFYDYVAWLEYIVKHFLKPWGYVLNGEVDWGGEGCRYGEEDRGTIYCVDNCIATSHDAALKLLAQAGK